ncbi:MAG: hypothetical protein M3348_17595 [Acidobacteriota bacterium]|nr:hypothetical protein [Acidobacteriota bacterium]
MKHTKAVRALVAALLLTLLVVAAFGSQWNRQVSVTGGSAQRLDGVLAAGGYSATAMLAELTICNPPSNANTLYVGQSDVDATNGVPLAPGDCKTERATNPQDAIQAAQIYLYVSGTQNAAFSVRSK